MGGMGHVRELMSCFARIFHIGYMTMGISESLTCFAEALVSMATQRISHLTEDLVEASEAIAKYADEKNNDGPMLSDSRALIYSFQRWYQTRESVPTEPGGLLDAGALLQDLRTWYLGNRHLLPSSKRRSLDDRMQPHTGIQPHTGMHGTAPLPATPAQATVAARAGLLTPEATPSLPLPATPRCTIAALRRTWAREECGTWTEALKDMDAQLSLETWFLGWSDNHYGFGIKQACCGAKCPRGFKPIGKTVPILYTPIVAHFPKRGPTPEGRIGYIYQTLLGCIYACSPKCAAEAADPRGLDRTSKVAPFSACSVQPDRRLLAAKDSDAGRKIMRSLRKQMSPPAAAAVADAVGPSSAAGGVAPAGPWGEVVLGLPEPLREELKAAPPKAKRARRSAGSAGAGPSAKRSKAAAAPSAATALTAEEAILVSDGEEDKEDSSDIEDIPGDEVALPAAARLQDQLGS